jgi:hypothetical protein
MQMNRGHLEERTGGVVSWRGRRWAMGASVALAAISLSGAAAIGASASPAKTALTVHRNSVTPSTLPSIPKGHHELPDLAGAKEPIDARVRPTVGGVVQAISGSTITIKDRSGATLSIVVSSATSYVDHAATAPTIANVTVGEPIGVVGMLSGSTVSATQIIIDRPPNFGPHPADLSESNLGPIGSFPSTPIGD